MQRGLQLSWVFLCVSLSALNGRRRLIQTHWCLGLTLVFFLHGLKASQGTWPIVLSHRGNSTYTVWPWANWSIYSCSLLYCRCPWGSSLCCVQQDCQKMGHYRPDWGGHCPIVSGQSDDLSLSRLRFALLHSVQAVTEMLPKCFSGGTL